MNGNGNRKDGGIMLFMRRKKASKTYERTIQSEPNKEDSDRRPFCRRLIRFSVSALIISLLLEIFIFNYASYALIGRDYTGKVFDISDRIKGLAPYGKDTGLFQATSERPVIEIKDINIPVKTLYIDVSSQKQDRYELNIDLDYTDSTHINTNYSPKILRIIPDLERSKYTICHYFGNTGIIRITLKVDVGEILKLGNVEVNSPIPFSFSLIRILILTLSAITVYILLKSPAMRVPCKEWNRARLVSGSVVFLAFILLLMGTYILFAGSGGNPFNQKSGDQLSQELVDAFEKGQLSLLETPSQKLLEMENPYDWGAREDIGVNYKWDHLLYNGKYYSYYGIAPVLLLFMPYHLLTGYYLPSNFACLLFAVIGVFFLYFAYWKMIENWFNKTPVRLAICGLIILLMSCGIALCVLRPMFYEASESAGFMFFSVGIYALFSSNILTDKKIKLLKLALSALFVSLAVLSRPTFALYAIGLLFWIGYGFVQYRKTNSGKYNAIRYFSAALLPYIILGGVQMAYNYARFGSFFDFGIQYSLTINDFTKTEFYPLMAFISFWNMLFAAPVFKSEFPFLTSSAEKWGLNGSYFFETGNIFGLFWRALPLYSIFYAPGIMKKMSLRDNLRYILLLGIPGVVIPIILIISTWESGYALRYNVDFAGQMLLVALALIFFVYNRMENKPLKRILSTVMIWCTVLSVIGNFALIFQHIPGTGNTIFINREATLFYYRIARTLEFWF